MYNVLNNIGKYKEFNRNYTFEFFGGFCKGVMASMADNLDVLDNLIEIHAKYRNVNSGYVKNNLKKFLQISVHFSGIGGSRCVSFTCPATSFTVMFTLDITAEQYQKFLVGEVALTEVNIFNTNYVMLCLLRI